MAATKPQFAGMSILDRLWQDLDDVMDQLMTEEPPADWTDEHVRGKDPKDNIGVASEWQAWGELRGQAQGLAYAISLIMNPYVADVPAVRALAKKRYEQREAGEEVDPLPTRPESIH